MSTTSRVSTAPRLLVEPTSPFVRRESDEVFVERRAPREAPVAVSILKDPDRVVDLIVEKNAIDRVVLASLLCLAVSTLVFTNVTLARAPWLDIVRASVLVPTNILLALAATLGPLYATSIVFAARVPIARLVAVLLSSTATGAMILAALAPIPWFAFSTDTIWRGPIALCAVFVVAGGVAGSRLMKSLSRLAARSSNAPLTDDEKHRIAIVGRIGFMLVALTVGVAAWGFDALSPVRWM